MSVTDLLPKVMEGKEGAYLFLHDNPAPDLDALGAAMGFAKLLRDVFDIPSIISSTPLLTHAQNKKMVSEMDLSIVDPHEDDFMDNMEKSWAIIFLDFNQHGESFSLSHVLTPDWVVDHHLSSETKSVDIGKHIDIQNVGSTCTLVTEYLQEFGVTFSDESPDDRMVATAMMLGLMMDTNNLKGSPDKVRDTNAFLFLMDHYDEQLYDRIELYKYPAYFYEYENEAYTRKQIVGSFVVIGLGFIPASRAGVIPQLADHWNRRDNTRTAVVFAITGDKELTASVRTDRDATERADDVVKKLFPESGAGGRKQAAGVCLTFHPFWDLKLLDEESKDKFVEITTQLVVERAKKIAEIDE